MLGGIHLTDLSRIVDNAAHDRTQSVVGTGRGEQSTPLENTVKPSATGEKGSNWKSTAYSTTRLAINLVKESADAFPPLKSVMGGLSAILDHCDVRFLSYPTLPMTLTVVLANNGVSKNDRIVDASSRRVGGIAKWACSRG